MFTPQLFSRSTDVTSGLYIHNIHLVYKQIFIMEPKSEVGAFLQRESDVAASLVSQLRQPWKCFFILFGPLSSTLAILSAQPAAVKTGRQQSPQVAPIRPELTLLSFATVLLHFFIRNCFCSSLFDLSGMQAVLRVYPWNTAQRFNTVSAYRRLAFFIPLEQPGGDWQAITAGAVRSERTCDTVDLITASP